MTLIPEDGTGLANADIPVALTWVDSFHSRRGNTAWTGAAEPEKEVAAVKATDAQEGGYRASLSGDRLNADQRLSYPRVNAYRADGRPIAPNTVPIEWLEGFAHLCLIALTTALQPSLDRGGQIKTLTVGPITFEYADGAPVETIHVAVEDAIRPLRSDNGTFLHRG